MPEPGKTRFRIGVKLLMTNSVNVMYTIFLAKTDLIVFKCRVTRYQMKNEENEFYVET